MFSLLDRTIMFETLRLLVLYAVAFLVLISIAVTVPLVRAGAPLWDVLLLLPDQLAFPATLALPLALVTATLSSLGRIREDGELTALMSAGISGWRVARANAPIAVLMMLVVEFLAHIMLPVAYRNFAAGKASLLRQALATKVARQEPIYQATEQGSNPEDFKQISLAALSASGNRLGHIFSWQVSGDGTVAVTYAPQGVWNTATFVPEPPDLAEQRAQLQANFATIPADQRAEAEAVLIRAMSSQAVPEDPAARTKLAEDLLLSRVDESAEHDDKERTALRLNLAGVRILRHDIEPLSVHWPSPYDLYLSSRLDDETDPATGANPYTENVPYPVTAGVFPSWAFSFDNEDNVGNPPDAQSTNELAAQIPLIQENINAFRTAEWPAAMAKQTEPFVLDAQRKLRSLQMAWHMRMMLPIATIGYWLFACGLALAIPGRNRLTAIFIGILTVIGTVIPAFATVKGMGGHLGFNPGILLWTPPFILAVIGVILLRLKR